METKVHAASRIPHKVPRADLRQQYAVTVLLGLVLALLLVGSIMRAPLYDTEALVVVMEQQEVVQMEEIKQTKQEVAPPPPPRPPVPVEVPNDEVLEDAVLDLDASLDLDEPLASLPPPPPPPAEEPAPQREEEIFVIVEQMPEILPSQQEGLRQMQEQIKYPEIAKKAGIHGRVFVQFIVDEKGNVVNPVVVRGIGGGCDEEALRAVRTLKFRPGKQRGKAVRVRYSIPVLFRLVES